MFDEAPTPRMFASDLDHDDATVPIPVVHGGVRARPSDPGGDLANSYESVNLVRSDLILEFERRGVALAGARKETAELTAALADAEEAKRVAEAEASRWRAAKDETDRQRRATVEDASRERSERDADAVAAAERNASLEAELAIANAALAAAEEKMASREAARHREDAAATESEAETNGDALKRAAKAESAAAVAEDDARRAVERLREVQLEAQRDALARRELEERLEATENALEAAEALVGDAEAAVAAAQADAAEARGATGSGAGSAEDASRIAELEVEVAALRAAARADAETVEAARRAGADASRTVAAEERASAAEARAERAEARAAAAEASAADVSRDVGDRDAWTAALARVPGVSTPDQLAEAVIRLERDLTAAIGGGGESAAEAAAARATAAAERRRADDADAARAAAKSTEEEAIAALARAERKVNLLVREKESLDRIIKSYEDEDAAKGGGKDAGADAAAVSGATTASASGADPFLFGGGATPSASTPPRTPADARRAEMESSLRDARERVAALESEVAACTAAASSARSVAAEHARAAADASAALASATTRAESAEREAEALRARVGAGEFNPGTTKVLHLRANPESLANESAAERELAVVRGECEALRETVAQFHAAQAAAAAANAAGAGAGGGAAVGSAAGATPAKGATPLASVAATPGPFPFTPGPAIGFGATPGAPAFAATPGPSVAEAELTVARRRVADLEKREQRYMAMFKKQIWNFREAVYLIFGYKVDMGEDTATGMPTATLRSKFAAREDELITIRVEPAKVRATGAAGGGKVDLLPTPYAETPEVKLMVDTFVGRCRSVPAFVANLTMELFNKQTLA